MHYQGGKEEEGMKKEETKVMTKMKMKEEEREEMMKDREERKEREEEREEAEIEEALLPDQYSRQTPKCQQPLSCGGGREGPGPGGCPGCPLGERRWRQTCARLQGAEERLQPRTLCTRGPAAGPPVHRAD